MIEKTFLDLNKVKLYGWEAVKDWLTIDSIIRGIEAGDDFPAVPVIQISPKLYILDQSVKSKCSMYKDGGHNRATAHYIWSAPLKVELIKRRGFSIYLDITNVSSDYYDISETKLDDIPGDFEYRKSNSPNWR